MKSLKVIVISIIHYGTFLIIKVVHLVGLSVIVYIILLFIEKIFFKPG